MKKKIPSVMLLLLFLLLGRMPAASAYASEAVSPTISPEEAKAVLAEYIAGKPWANKEIKSVSLFGDGYLSSNGAEITFSLYADISSTRPPAPSHIGYVTLNLATQKGYIRYEGFDDASENGREYFDLSSDGVNRFFDVQESDWYYDAVQYVIQHNLFAGVRTTEFMPEAPMTRAMLMVVLARLDGQDTEGGTVWYEKGMAWAEEQGISDGSHPDDSITREQIVTMLYRYAGEPETAGTLQAFTDVEEIDEYAATALCWATEQGILVGSNNGTLYPREHATRAQVATMLMRYCENVKE